MLSARTKQWVVALTVVGVLALMLLAAEAAVRVRQQLSYGTSATSEDYYALDSTSGLRVPIANLSSGRISVNSSGFRGPEITMPKRAGTVRIAFLGASTTWCAEVSGNEQVWPHLATAALGHAFPHAQFDYVNAGVPGYTIGSLLKALEQRVAPLQPDVAVIYEAANNLSAEMRELAARQGVIAEARMQEPTWPGRYSLLWNLVEKNLKVMAAQRKAATRAKLLNVDAAAIGREYRETLTQLVREAQRHVKLVAVATFSIQPRKDQPFEAQMRAAASAFVYMPFVTPELLVQAYERYNEIIREVARDTGAYLIEGEKDIPGDSRHFADTVHFTDEGSKAMAARVSRALLSSRDLRHIVESNTAVTNRQ